METSSMEEALKYVRIVKERFHNQPELFDEFSIILKDLNSNRNEPYGRLLKLMNMFSGHKDLISGLNNYLPDKYKMPVGDDDEEKVNDKMALKNFCKASSIDSILEFINKVGKRFAKDGRARTKFLETLVLYREKEININQVDVEFSALFKEDPDLYVDFTRFLVDYLEKEYTVSHGKNFQGGEFVTRGSKGRRKKDLYEKTLLIWEFYKYELDMVSEWIKSTAEKLLENPKKIEENFKVLNFRCIEELYGGDEAGQAVVKSLRENPGRTAEIVIPRLLQKSKELEEFHCEIDKVWAEILEDIREKRAVRHSWFLEPLLREIPKIDRRIIGDY